MLGIIRFELNIRIKMFISELIMKKAVKRNGYYEFIGSTKLVNKYGIEKCGAVYLNSSIYIIWDKEFYNDLTPPQRLFCRFHELGHFNGYTSITEFMSHERKLNEEVKADSFAFKRMGYDNALNAMTGILDYLDEIQQTEMRQRINIQKSMNIVKQVVRDNTL